ncbi:unnamed protein product [Ascophyllum nodosum]
MMIVPRLLFFLSMLFGLTHTFVPNPGFRRTSTDRRPQALQSPTLPCFSYTLTRTPRRKAASEGSANPGDGFTFVDLQRELNRRQAEEEMARQRPSFSMQAGEAFMAEQMMLRQKLLKAYVLVYNQGQAEEGVYTLFVEGRNVLRAWEEKTEAARYALMLRTEDLPLGKPTELRMMEIISFCKENGVGLELVPRGRGLQPPSINKPEFDFECVKRETDSIGDRGNDSLFSAQELTRLKGQLENLLEGGEEEA